MGLPRPQEPRPSLHGSWSDSSTAPRRPATYYGPSQVDNRSQYPSLPGVKDILTDTSAQPGPPPAAWGSHGQTSAHIPNGDTFYQERSLHPPMALHPPHIQTGHSPGQQSRPFEVPVLDTTRVNKHAPHAVPISPYSRFPDSARDYPETHPEAMQQRFNSMHVSNGTHVPSAASVVPGDAQCPSPAAGFDRPSRSPNAGQPSENQRKYLGTHEIPGDGAYHLYEGNYRIPAYVDGEPVNPAWGLTKALKPRKRLALACMDCREKKIKCEPGAHSCVQCEKAKRPCRRSTAQGPQSTASPSSWQDNAPSPPRNNPSTSAPTPALEQIISQDAWNKRRDRADPSPPNGPSKKQRSTSPVSQPHEIPQTTKVDTPGFPIAPVTQAGGRGLMNWDEDPYSIDPELTMHMLDLYFEHMNSALYWLYPRDHFLHWTRTCSDKCQNERMVLYAMLAAASVFAPHSLSGFGKECATIAGDAISSQLGKFNVAVAHTKMMLALYHFAKGSVGIPWDHVGSAVRTITFVQLHTEQGCYDDSTSAAQPRIEFAFSTEQLAECKRRTFWSCFLMDRLAGPTVCMIKPQDIFLRLPCSEDDYDQSIRSNAPYYPNENIDPSLADLTPSSSLSPMAWLVLVASVLGDIIDSTFCAPHRPAATYREAYQKFYSDARYRLQAWSSQLPHYLTYSEANLNGSIQRGYFHAFVCMHTLYHTAHMKLNQCLRHAQMPEVITRNIREAHFHAQEQLRMMTAVLGARRPTQIDGRSTECMLSIPFAGYGTLVAIDIIGAGGPESNLPPTLALIEGGLRCLQELSIFWNSAKDQFKACERRYWQIKKVVVSGQKYDIGAWLGRRWGIELPMDRDLPRDHDVIYGLGESTEAIKLYFDAFRED
ncbi:uncharacterized protein LTR77_009840 [Saxophila tyrrhenica]|uniref:Zn(2)-C6 fungal-type domain-containing protein n=1 Tax=Saxophila tyrrhenica TaxID=1690608 RepID=A0AAV9NXL0_9PEZI|nr:hypothetical protein LTR77_009840 [Saxophila tyrrhenica]